MARKTAATGYQPHYPNLAFWMAHAGLTEEQIAEQFGVDRRTINRWKKSHLDFGASLEAGKETPDDEVEAALLRRAKGYVYTEEKVTHQGDVVTVELERAPDTTACIFWLKNRRPLVWRDKHEVEANVTGNINIVIPADIKDL